jgi:CheY-like chemotaxis protein
MVAGVTDRAGALRALVVEQDAGVRAVVREVLQGRGYAVHAVSSRAEGFDLMDGLAPALLFLDDPARERARRLVRLDPEGAPDVLLADDVRPEQIRAWLEEALSA